MSAEMILITTVLTIYNSLLITVYLTYRVIRWYDRNRAADIQVKETVKRIEKTLGLNKPVIVPELTKEQKWQRYYETKQLK